ncbi:MAG: hypothetical protein WA057_04390 [Candidatus Magasanikiibacteriota bacterium]
MKKIENVGKFAKHTTEAHNALLKAIPSWVYEKNMQYGIIGNKNLPNIMEDVFRKIYEGSISFSFGIRQTFIDSDIPMWHNDFFSSIISVSGHKIISTNEVEELSKYVVSKTGMNDSLIQDKVRSGFLEEDLFFAILYLLIFKPESGKEFLNLELKKDKLYLFHVNLDSLKKVSITIFWNDGKWMLSATDFNFISSWDEGRIFVYFCRNY